MAISAVAIAAPSRNSTELADHLRRRVKTRLTPILFNSHSKVRTIAFHQPQPSVKWPFQPLIIIMKRAAIRAIMEKKRRVSHHLVLMVRLMVRRTRVKRALSLTISQVKRSSSTMDSIKDSNNMVNLCSTVDSQWVHLNTSMCLPIDTITQHLMMDFNRVAIATRVAMQDKSMEVATRPTIITHRVTTWT